MTGVELGWMDRPELPVVYSGGESSRLYQGEYVVAAQFRWPDGTRGTHETEPSTYEEAMDWLARAPHVPLVAVDPDTGREHRVRVLSARIVPAAEVPV